MDKAHIIEVLNSIELTKGSIELYTADSKPTVDALIWRNLAAHASLDEGYNITHIPTGLALSQGYNDVRAAILGLKLLAHTVKDMDPDPFNFKVQPKRVNKTLKAIGRWLAAHKKVWNNAETESVVGVFYKDRSDCERLRHKINPNLPIEYLDENAYDERSIADRILAVR